MTTYRILNKIVKDRQIIGFKLICTVNNRVLYLGYNDIVSILQKDPNTIQGIKLNKDNKIIGDSLDLRKVKSIQGNAESIGIDEDTLANWGPTVVKNKTYRLKSSDTNEQVVFVKLEPGVTRKLKLHKIKADTLIVYSSDKNQNTLQQIDINTVKVKNIVFINVNNNLFDLLADGIYLPRNSDLMVDKVTKFVGDLDSISYIKTDTLLQSDELAIDSRNTNWIDNHRLSGTTEQFIESFTRMILGGHLKIEKYLSKLYNDRVIRQIVTGHINLSTVCDAFKVEQFSDFKTRLNDVEILQGKRQLLAFQVNSNNWENGEPPKDYLIDLDNDVIAKILHSKNRLNVIKLLWPSNQFIKLHPQEVWIDGQILRNNILREYNKTNPNGQNTLQSDAYILYSRIKEEMFRNNQSDYMSVLYKNLQDFQDSWRDASQELYRLEARLKLLGDGVNIKSEDAARRFAEAIIIKVKSLADKHNIFNYCIYNIVEYFIVTYQNFCEYVFGLSDTEIDLFDCIQAHINIKIRNNKAVHSLIFQYKDGESMLKHPEYGFIVTQLRDVCKDLQMPKLDIDLQAYKFYSLQDMRYAFRGCRIHSISMSQFNFARLRDMSITFDNQIVEYLIIVDQAFPQLNITTGDTYMPQGNVIIFNTKFKRTQEFTLGDNLHATKVRYETTPVVHNSGVIAGIVNYKTQRLLGTLSDMKTNNLFNFFTDSWIILYSFSNILQYTGYEPLWKGYSPNQEILDPQVFAAKAKYDYEKYIHNHNYTDLLELSFVRTKII